MDRIEQLGRERVAEHRRILENASNSSTPLEQPRAERFIRDTVELSDDGQKIINLSRGAELADEVRNKPVDKDFASFLTDAMADVKRVSQIFSGTIRSVFSFYR